MDTIVEAILDSDTETLQRILGEISDFFSNGPERLGPLRLAVLGVIDAKGDDPQWMLATEKFDSLFSGKVPGFKPLKQPKIIKRFTLRDLDSNREHLPALLALFVFHEIESRPNLLQEQTRPILREAFSVDQTLERLRRYLKTESIEALAPRTGGYEIGPLVKTIHRSLGTDDQTSIRNLLFGGNTRRRLISNYAMYRYSTAWGAVVKSFLTILSPAINDYGSYTFTHVYGPGDKSFKRISRGILLPLEKSICFLAGGSLNVEAGNDRVTSPLNRGFKAFAIPDAAFDPDHRLLTGVMLSNSRSWFPIVGRFAMLHLGFSNAKSEITDDTAGLAFMNETSELAPDIRRICQTFKLGDQAFADNAVAFVLNKMNNYPVVDRSLPARHALGLLRSITIEEEREPPP